MWDPLTWYYDIRSDAEYSRELPTDVIIKVLKNTGVLKRTAPQSFTNKDDFPWLDITAIKSNNGNYGHKEDFNSQYCNLIAVVASKSNPDDEAKYVELLTKVANELNWELILEQDDDGNEDIILNPAK
jgi:hypothetical protein